MFTTLTTVYKAVNRHTRINTGFGNTIAKKNENKMRNLEMEFWRTHSMIQRNAEPNPNKRLNHIWSYLKSRAKQNKTLLTLTQKQFYALRQLPCRYCKGTLPLTGHGIDRFDRNMGYTSENSVPACGPCNFRKGGLEAAGFTGDRAEQLMQELLETIGPAKRSISNGRQGGHPKRRTK